MELRAHVSTEFEANLEQAGFKAAIRYLQRIGYDVIDREAATQAGIVDLVAVDNGTLTFVTIYVSYHRMPSVRTLDDNARYDLERRAMSWLAEADEEFADMPVTFDVVYLGILSPHRALVRHHRSIMATPWDQDRPTDDNPLMVGPYVPGFKLNKPMDDRDVIKASDVDDPDGLLLPDDDDPPFDEDPKDE